MQRLYVLVRTDLTYSSSAVQAGHAVAQFCLDNIITSCEWNNHTLIYLAVRDYKELEKWMFKLEKKNVKFSLFYEPEINQITAISGLVNDQRIFKSLKLLE
jgi:hypothetical protein